jgi:thiol-disulfide isomerase/thioredoxin
MKWMAVLCMGLMWNSAAWAGDFSFAFEGDEAKRAPLSALQGSANPPALQLEEWTHTEPLTLDALKGKIVVLDFWATWCGPCIASIPHTNELAKKYAGDVVFLGVCHQRGGEKMAETVKEKGIEYPVALDPNNATIKAYAVNSYPDYYILDRNGKLVVADCANDKVEEVIQILLKQ